MKDTADAAAIGECVKWGMEYYSQHLDEIGDKDGELAFWFVPSDELKALFDAKGGEIKVLLRAVTPEQYAKRRDFKIDSPTVMTWTPEAVIVE